MDFLKTYGRHGAHVLVGLGMIFFEQEWIEILIKIITSSSFAKKMHLGVFAYAYMEHLKCEELRVASIGNKKLVTNISEPLGLNSYFFGSDEIAKFANALLPKNGIFLDIGANMGHWSIWAAERVQNRGKVYAFEPNLKVARLLECSKSLNGFQHFFQIRGEALWSESNQTLPFFLSKNPRNTGTSSLKNRGGTLNAQESIEVCTLKLDDFFEQEKIEYCDFIKIDVESVELEVLKGMRQILNQKLVTTILIETVWGSPPVELLSSYDYFCIGESTSKGFSPITHVKEEQFGDFIFVRKDRAEAIIKKIELEN
jgi:FkbM family methyltransferase